MLSKLYKLVITNMRWPNMSFNVQTSTVECSSSVSLRASTVGLSNFPAFRAKYQLQAMMIKLKVEAKKLFRSISAGDMLEFDRGLIEVVSKKVLQPSILKKLSRNNHEPIINVTSAKEQLHVIMKETL